MPIGPTQSYCHRSSGRPPPHRLVAPRQGEGGRWRGASHTSSSRSSRLPPPSSRWRTRGSRRGSSLQRPSRSRTRPWSGRAGGLAVRAYGEVRVPAPRRGRHRPSPPAHSGCRDVAYDRCAPDSRPFGSRRGRPGWAAQSDFGETATTYRQRSSLRPPPQRLVPRSRASIRRNGDEFTSSKPSRPPMPTAAPVTASSKTRWLSPARQAICRSPAPTIPRQGGAGGVRPLRGGGWSGWSTSGEPSDRNRPGFLC